MMILLRLVVGFDMEDDAFDFGAFFTDDSRRFVGKGVADGSGVLVGDGVSDGNGVSVSVVAVGWGTVAVKVAGGVDFFVGEEDSVVGGGSVAGAGALQICSKVMRGS